MSNPEEVVVLDYAELLVDPTPELCSKIEKAFGYDGLGLLAVRGVPDFAEKRAKGLPFAYRFGNLPDPIKQKYVHEASTYSFGWSHGKEKLQGKPDYAKGSFYANPTYDRPVDDEALIKQFPSFIHPNIWPSSEDCEGFEQAFKELGQVIVNTGLLLAKACDAFVMQKLPDIQKKNRLHDIIVGSKCTKARLLYYFPVKKEDETSGSGSGSTSSSTTVTTTTTTTTTSGNTDDISSWCGWHNDHGSLTGLTPAMYFDEKGTPDIPCPDPKAGLYIRSRNGKTIRAVIPPNCIAYQIGETSQIHSGGVLQATPHCVRAAHDASGSRISRGTLAVFMEPNWDEPMDVAAGADPELVLRGAKGELLPPGVPKLVDRWEQQQRPQQQQHGGDGAVDELKEKVQTFGEFTDKTLGSYY